MFEYFPGNYRWSYNTLLALAAGGQIGDIELVWSERHAGCADDSLWHARWTQLAGILQRRAERSLLAHGAESAGESLFLACLYHMIGEHFLQPDSPARQQSYAAALRAFERGRSLSPWRIERVEIPYEGKSLPAHFIPCAGGNRPRPAVIFLCGLDTTKEISFLRVRQELASRGMHCLVVDTPGVGEALRTLQLPTRYDYEKPVGAVVDYLGSRADVDGDAIGIIGSSLGGYYVARAAAFDQRLRAAVAWGVVHDYHEVWARRLAGRGLVAAPSFQLMFVTGTRSMEDALERISGFRVAPIGARILCPFLVVHGSDDRQVFADHVTAMYDCIGSRDKELKVFSGEDGGAAHCQFDNHPPAMQYIADWLRTRLSAQYAPVPDNSASRNCPGPQS